MSFRSGRSPCDDQENNNNEEKMEVADEDESQNFIISSSSSRDHGNSNVRTKCFVTKRRELLIGHSG